VNLANTAWYSGFAAFHQGCVSLAHKVLIHRSSGGVVQGKCGGVQRRQHAMIDCHSVPGHRENSG